MRSEESKSNPSSVCLQDESLWLNIGSKVQQHFGVDTLMHLTCHLPVVCVL